ATAAGRLAPAAGGSPSGLGWKKWGIKGGAFVPLGWRKPEPVSKKWAVVGSSRPPSRALVVAISCRNSVPGSAPEGRMPSRRICACGWLARVAATQAATPEAVWSGDAPTSRSLMPIISTTRRGEGPASSPALIWDWRDHGVIPGVPPAAAPRAAKQPAQAGEGWGGGPDRAQRED